MSQTVEEAILKIKSAALSGKRGKEKTADNFSLSTVYKGQEMVEVIRKI